MLQFYVHVHSWNGDLEADSWSENDLTARVTYGNQSRVTTTKWDKNTPSWEETFLFPYEAAEKSISVDLTDKDKWGPDDVIARINIPIKGEEEESVIKDGLHLTYKVGKFLGISTLKTYKDVVEEKSHKIEQYISEIKENYSFIL